MALSLQVNKKKILIIVQMIAYEILQKLQNIVRGELQEGQIDTCSAIRNLLCQSFGTSPTVKSEFARRAILKEKQVTFLKFYAKENNLWLESLPANSKYLTEGGESKVYLTADGHDVIKINDAGYYATWTEYFNSLVLHNILFDNAPYSFLGFTEADGKLLVVLKQPFVVGEQVTLDEIEEFLNFNGFKKTKRQDYYNEELKLALEDMHDENVIANEEALFLIDTVFYIMG